MRSRRGFTLIELLVVLTIIGILASIAIPKYRGTKERALVASMISDLRTLVASQEGFYSQNDDYAGGVWTNPERAGKGGRGRISFVPSPGNSVSMARRTAGGAVGWRATVRNPQVTNRRTDVCGIYVGHPSFAPNARVIAEGVPVCY
jgi:prepilin-type N-terminal cleavage/methylation domain-containing protein